MERNKAGRNRLIHVGFEHIILCLVLRLEGVAHPHKIWHMNLVIAWQRRCVEEHVAGIVEYILAMVACVNHGRAYTKGIHGIDDTLNKGIGVSDRVVIAVHEQFAILARKLLHRIGSELGKFPTVAAVIVVVAAITVEHNEFFAMVVAKLAL